jgi:hypothetical protein
MADALRRVRGTKTQRELGMELAIDTMRISRWERAACTPSVRLWRLLHERWPDEFPENGRPDPVPKPKVPPAPSRRAKRSPMKAAA